jgi:signal transduction histidine kinase
MNRGAAAAEATPWRLLSSAAVGHLAHDMRGCIHVIGGHAELIGAEAFDDQARESAGFILESNRLLGSLCEDVIDFLRLPETALGEPVVFALDDLTTSLSMLASDQGVQLRMVEADGGVKQVRVHPAVRRVVTHVLEHAVRAATSDVTIAVTGPAKDSCAIVVSPVTADILDSDGIVAIAAALLAAHRGCLSVSGRRLEFLIPIVGPILGRSS